jgi:hypothetical protein
VQHYYHCIDINPVLARLIDDPAEWHWSSCVANSTQRADASLVPHASWLVRRSVTRIEMVINPADQIVRATRGPTCQVEHMISVADPCMVKTAPLMVSNDA